jgi:hypothetical protein
MLSLIIDAIKALKENVATQITGGREEETN